MADQLADADLQHLLDMDDILTRTCSWDVQSHHTAPGPTTPDARAALRPELCPDSATAPITASTALRRTGRNDGASAAQLGLTSSRQANFF